MDADYTLGIDPGLSGALALISLQLKKVYIWDMPTQLTQSGKRQVDPYALFKILRAMQSDYAPVNAWIERVQSMPKQGVTSMFSFGEGAGVLRACLACAEIPMQYIVPRVWKQYVGLKGAEKKAALTTAKQLIPFAAEHLTLQKHVGRADALLIAYAGILRRRDNASSPAQTESK